MATKKAQIDKKVAEDNEKAEAARKELEKQQKETIDRLIVKWKDSGTTEKEPLLPMKSSGTSNIA